MKRIGEKLKSQRGASILLALLFFLLCAMVGASVLMAAASNAGRSRISRAEQQKYLTLSSALQLVCDELESASYTAKYTYNYTPPPKNDKGETTGSAKHEYTQSEGEYIGGLSSAINLSKNVLPLRDELDWLFAQDFARTLPHSDADVVYSFTSRGGIQKPETPHELTLTVQEQDDRPGLTTPVTVTVTLGSGENQTVAYRLSLKATLGGEGDPIYTMYAQLDLKGEAPHLTTSQEGVENSSNKAEWELKQITREEAK